MDWKLDLFNHFKDVAEVLAGIGIFTIVFAKGISILYKRNGKHGSSKNGGNGIKSLITPGSAEVCQFHADRLDKLEATIAKHYDSFEDWRKGFEKEQVELHKELVKRVDPPKWLLDRINKLEQDIESLEKTVGRK